MDPIIIWDLDDDPDGNVRHIAEHGLTVEEIESVLLDLDNETDVSASSGRPITFGWTHTGRHIAVVWEQADDDPLAIYPVTAYETPPRSGRRF
jgi:uncharacterized DUF497 family protein